MAVFVDHSRLPWRGKSWCHLVADSVHELHSFADQLGLKRSWFQHKTSYPHYDVTVSVRLKALALGAQPGDKQTIVSCAKRLRTELVLAKVDSPDQTGQCMERGKSSDQLARPVQQPLFAA